jgi:fumarylacetoacetase
MILDIGAAFDAGVLKMAAEDEAVMCTGRLDDLLAAGPRIWAHVRKALCRFLSVENKGVAKDNELIASILVPQRDAIVHRPVEMIGDYTDFYASIHHATNVGSMFRPDNPLLPNYKHLPVGYHGRASSLVVSGTSVRRPMGQTVASDAGPPAFGPCKLLDYEMEMGFFVGPGNEIGERISMINAVQHIFGMVIVNDWSARDVQKWEYQPLGPFNAKNFCTTISPWVVTLDALEPFRVPEFKRDANDPQPLDYLKPAGDMGFDITVEVRIASQQMRE